jgi:5-formyltetrahydrofolate cyclo-ligase
MRSKDAIRESIWQSLEKNKIARFPGAVGRIPNFIGAESCAEQLAATPHWQAARVLKINPDSPQRAIRRRALADGKTIYMAVPRLRSDKPFIRLDPKKLKCSPYAASSIKGAGQYGRPVTLKEMPKIDLIVCGSVAVNRQGARVGKGGGYSDLEFALLMETSKLGANVSIVTSVHGLQIIDEEIPMTAHDIPLTAIATPTAVIGIAVGYARPRGIYWNLLPQEKIAAIPVLENFRRRTLG